MIDSWVVDAARYGNHAGLNSLSHILQVVVPSWDSPNIPLHLPMRG